MLRFTLPARNPVIVILQKSEPGSQATTADAAIHVNSVWGRAKIVNAKVRAIRVGVLKNQNRARSNPRTKACPAFFDAEVFGEDEERFRSVTMHQRCACSGPDACQTNKRRRHSKTRPECKSVAILSPANAPVGSRPLRMTAAQRLRRSTSAKFPPRNENGSFAGMG